MTGSWPVTWLTRGPRLFGWRRDRHPRLDCCLAGIRSCCPKTEVKECHCFWPLHSAFVSPPERRWTLQAESQGGPSNWLPKSLEKGCHGSSRLPHLICLFRYKRLIWQGSEPSHSLFSPPLSSRWGRLRSLPFLRRWTILGLSARSRDPLSIAFVTAGNSLMETYSFSYRKVCYHRIEGYLFNHWSSPRTWERVPVPLQVSTKITPQGDYTVQAKNIDTLLTLQNATILSNGL